MMIDLKNSTISFEDGYSAIGAVDNVAGYPIGTTTMIVDGFVGQVPVGARLTIDGVAGFTVVSTVETVLNTTSITFSPALTAAVTDADVILAGPRFLDIKVGEGNLTWSEKKAREYKLDRGLLDQVRDGDQQPMDVSFQLMYEELTAGTPATDPPTPEDVLKRRDPADEWLNTDPANCNVFAINISLIHNPALCVGVKKEKVVLPKFRYEQLDHDPKAGTISCQGKCNAVEAIVTRFA